MTTLTLNNSILFRANKEDKTRVEKGIDLKEIKFEDNETIILERGSVILAKSNEEISGMISRVFELPKLAGYGLIIRVADEGKEYSKEEVAIEIINAGETSVGLDVGMNLCVVAISDKSNPEHPLKKKKTK